MATQKNKVGMSFLLIFGISIGLLSVEFIYRLYLFNQYANDRVPYKIMLTDTPYSPTGKFWAMNNIKGLYPPNTVMGISEYGMDNNFLQKHNVKIKIASEYYGK